MREEVSQDKEDCMGQFKHNQGSLYISGQRNTEWITFRPISNHRNIILTFLHIYLLLFSHRNNL